MAGSAHNQQYSDEPHSPLHWHKSLLEGVEDDCTLDTSILDTDRFNMAAVDHHQRRESFASNASLMSPPHQAWTDFAFHPDPSSNYPMHNPHPMHVFPEQVGGQFGQHHDEQHFVHYPGHMASWQHQANAGPDQSNPNFNSFAADINNIKPEAPYSTDVASTPHADVAFGGLPTQMETEYTHFPASAASPQWSTSSSDAVEKIPRSGQYQTSMFDHNPPHLRRDGVRKKNARFEIPEGRNLQTIDELISNTNPNDEDVIKELKQQKRLLRNRQAALDSRCRKKHHTEKLEEEKKHFLSVIDRLEEDVRNLQTNEQRWMHERQQWHQYSENLLREKEELLRQHTLETADLRRKNNYLMEEAHKIEGATMSAQTSSNGASAGYPDFEHLTMGGSPFQDFSFIDSSGVDMDVKPGSSLAAQPKKESPAQSTADDKSAASGLLLMLLLCGAWVASKSTSTSSAPIPRMPDDVRVASAVVLENIYKDAGIPPQTIVPASGGKASTKKVGPPQEFGKPRTKTSPLASLYHDIITPSKQQQRDQVFSLSVDQYDRLTSDNCQDTISDTDQAPRKRNLGQALAAMRAQKQGSAAEVYTRSLMLDKVPADLVRDFARMMEDSKRAEPLN